MSANTYLAPSPVAPPCLLISNISQTNPMVVTVSDDEDYTYIVGQVVHLTVPFDYGMFQADQMEGQIIAVSGLNLTLNINASQFDAFTVPSGNVVQPASLSPAGSRNIYNYSTVPFHAVDPNTGN